MTKETENIYSLSTDAFESVIKAFYYRAWADFKLHSGETIAINEAELISAQRRFSGIHISRRRQRWESHDLTLMSIYRMALEEFQYRSGIAKDQLIVPIAVQKNSVDSLKNTLVKLALKTVARKQPGCF